MHAAAKRVGSISEDFKTISTSGPSGGRIRALSSKSRIDQAAGSDRGDAIVSAMIAYLRERNIWLPSSSELERLALAARAVARKRAYRGLIEGLSTETVAALETLLIVADEKERTPFAGLREWPEAPRQKNLLAVVERLETVRKLGVGADRETRVHRARYAAIAKEIAILVPRDISRFDAPRRLATLVVFAREMEAVLTDAALAMFDKMLGAVFRRADRAHKTTWSTAPRRSTPQRAPCSAWPRRCSPPRQETKIRSPPSSMLSVGNA